MDDIGGWLKEHWVWIVGGGVAILGVLWWLSNRSSGSGASSALMTTDQGYPGSSTGSNSTTQTGSSSGSAGSSTLDTELQALIAALATAPSTSPGSTPSTAPSTTPSTPVSYSYTSNTTTTNNTTNIYNQQQAQAKAKAAASAASAPKKVVQVESNRSQSRAYLDTTKLLRKAPRTSPKPSTGQTSLTQAEALQI